MIYPSSLQRRKSSSHWVKICHTSLGRREGNENDADVKTHLTPSYSLKSCCCFQPCQKRRLKRKWVYTAFLHCILRQWGHQKTACITDGQCDRKGCKLLRDSFFHTRKNRPCQARNRLPLWYKMILANSYQMGNNPLWLGIQPAYHAAVDKTPAWGWEQKVRKMRGCFGLGGLFFLIFFFILSSVIQNSSQKLLR